MEHYGMLKDYEYIQFYGSDNWIRTDNVGTNGNMYYDHTVPFDLWEIDSWEDKKYWELLQIMSRVIKNGIDLFEFDFLCRQYGERNKKREDK